MKMGFAPESPIVTIIGLPLILLLIFMRTGPKLPPIPGRVKIPGTER